jgi:hypothetical protein
MFEDSTFESGGRIHSKSGRWMMVTFITNGAILIAMILYPLIYPEALPKAMMQTLLVAQRHQAGCREGSASEFVWRSWRRRSGRQRRRRDGQCVRHWVGS